MEQIDIGLAPRDGKGDGLREGGRKINQNFQELDQRLRSVEVGGISQDEGNRLTLGSDGGLYSRDGFEPNLLLHYLLARG